MAPRALATADVTGASYDNVVWGDVTKASSVTSSISDLKKPLYLSHRWCYGSNYGSSFILDTSCLVLIVILVKFVESEAAVAVLYQLFKIIFNLQEFVYGFFFLVSV